MTWKAEKYALIMFSPLELYDIKLICFKQKGVLYDRISQFCKDFLQASSKGDASGIKLIKRDAVLYNYYK